MVTRHTNRNPSIRTKESEQRMTRGATTAQSPGEKKAGPPKDPRMHTVSSAETESREVEEREDTQTTCGSEN